MDGWMGDIEFLPFGRENVSCVGDWQPVFLPWVDFFQPRCDGFLVWPAVFHQAVRLFALQ
jgi:hypothetical protein